MNMALMGEVRSKLFLLLLDILQYKNKHSLKFRRLKNNLKKGSNGQQFLLKKLAVWFFIAYICFHKFS